jgi:hypothetical protein
LWKKPEVPNGDVQKYRVNFLVVERQGLIEKRESVYHIEEFSGDNSSGILSRLEPYTTYTLELRAVNRIGSLDIIGNASNQLIVTTAEAAPSMPRQVSVSLIENRSDSLLVGWDVPSRPNGKIRLYRVYYTFSSVLFSSITPWKHETNSSETSAVITGLLAFTSYQFVVHCDRGLLLSCSVVCCVVCRCRQSQIREEIVVSQRMEPQMNHNQAVHNGLMLVVNQQTVLTCHGFLLSFHVAIFVIIE